MCNRENRKIREKEEKKVPGYQFVFFSYLQKK